LIPERFVLHKYSAIKSNRKEEKNFSGVNYDSIGATAQRADRLPLLMDRLPLNFLPFNCLLSLLKLTTSL
jgi:hypothetical protein